MAVCKMRCMVSAPGRHAEIATLLPCRAMEEALPWSSLEPYPIVLSTQGLPGRLNPKIGDGRIGYLLLGKLCRASSGLPRQSFSIRKIRSLAGNPSAERTAGTDRANLVKTGKNKKSLLGDLGNIDKQLEFGDSPEWHDQVLNGAKCGMYPRKAGIGFSPRILPDRVKEPLTKCSHERRERLFLTGVRGSEESFC